MISSGSISEQNISKFDRNELMQFLPFLVSISISIDPSFATDKVIFQQETQKIKTQTQTQQTLSQSIWKHINSIPNAPNVIRYATLDWNKINTEINSELASKRKQMDAGNVNKIRI